MARYEVRPGSSFPPGMHADGDGVNFCVFSRHATAMDLLLYDSADNPRPFQIVRLNVERNRTFFFWHVYIAGLPVGTYYTWRADGPDNTLDAGFRFDGGRELVDPWALVVSDALWDRRLASRQATRTSIRAKVIDDQFDWEGDQPLERRLEESIIYEMHVGGFTRHPSSGVANPGTFDAVVEKIPYLKSLGVTDIELLPVMAFDEQDVPLGAHLRGLKNFWGYSPHSFFAPHPGYCSGPGHSTQRDEFRNMVKALHRAGIGVILDVVFNHTAEGGSDGPVINFKGFGNEIFYHLDPDDRSRYRDYTGCGNTLNCNHPLVTRYIVACLEYWVREMHVDGFRFDLASVMVRGEDGEPQYHAPLPWAIEFSRTLARTRLIAEAWDAAGLYQVGDFPGFRWAEWNGRYRDVIRRFVRGDKGIVPEVATRVTGSSDLYQAEGRLPVNSINFVTCHDGFTLRDLVSYNAKHNMANGEGNRDGSDNNMSWNCGVEGETGERAVQELRAQQTRNFMAILLLSQGVPMLLAGDEVLRTQRGNNNTYCQDNELGWLDWRLVESNADMLRFVSGMIRLRKRHPAIMRRNFLTGERRPGAEREDIAWHGTRLAAPMWSDSEAQVLAYTLGATTGDESDLHIIMNMANESHRFALPALVRRDWHRAVDTALPAPDNLLEPGEQPAVDQAWYDAAPRSVVVLEGY